MVLGDIKSWKSCEERNNDGKHRELRGFTPEEFDQRRILNDQKMNKGKETEKIMFGGYEWDDVMFSN